MDSDEEAYKEFIVTSDEEEKENNVDKQAKTTRQQFELMIEFAKECEDQSMSKDELDRRWVSLTEKLNAIGPPVRSSLEWLRVWSVFKYNQKRKQPVSESRGTRKQQPVFESIGRLRQENPEQPIFVHPPFDRVPVVVSDGQPSVSNQILETMKDILSVVRDTNEKVTAISRNLSR